LTFNQSNEFELIRGICELWDGCLYDKVYIYTRTHKHIMQ